MAMQRQELCLCPTIKAVSTDFAVWMPNINQKSFHLTLLPPTAFASDTL